MTTLPLGPPPATQAARAVIPGRPVLLGRNTGDRLYRAALTGLALSLPLLLVALVVELGASAWPAITRFGFRFGWTSVWDPVAGVLGAAPVICGTMASSLLALLFAVSPALGGRGVRLLARRPGGRDRRGGPVAGARALGDAGGDEGDGHPPGLRRVRVEPRLYHGRGDRQRVQ